MDWFILTPLCIEETREINLFSRDEILKDTMRRHTTSDH